MVIFKLSRASFNKFNLYVVTKITQFVFCGLYMHILFLTRTVEMLNKTNLPIFILLLDKGTFWQHSTFGLQMNKEGLTGNEKDSFCSFCIQSKFWFNAKCDLLGLSASLLAQS